MSLHPAQIDMINQFVAALSNMGCEYHISIPDGETLANVEMVRKDQIIKSATLTYGRGVLTHYLRPFMDDVQVGQMVMIPHGGYDADLLRQAAKSHGHRLWGTGACQTLPGEASDDGFLVFRKVPAPA